MTDLGGEWVSWPINSRSLQLVILSRSPLSSFLLLFVVNIEVVKRRLCAIELPSVRLGLSDFMLLTSFRIIIIISISVFADDSLILLHVTPLKIIRKWWLDVSKTFLWSSFLNYPSKFVKIKEISVIFLKILIFFHCLWFWIYVLNFVPYKLKSGLFKVSFATS